jgi:hypothetical protein
MAGVPDFPDQLDATRHRDDPSARGVWVRRAILTVLLVFVLIGAFGVFGQPAQVSRAEGPAATLEVSAPTALRGGLLFMGLFDVVARDTVKEPTLVLGPGWLDDITVNTIEPSPLEENSRNRRLELTFPKVEKGDHLRIWMEFQVNPTAIGSGNQDVTLRDGSTPLMHVRRTVRIYP